MFCVVISLSGWGPSVQANGPTGLMRIHLIAAGLRFSVDP